MMSRVLFFKVEQYLAFSGMVYYIIKKPFLVSKKVGETVSHQRG